MEAIAEALRMLLPLSLVFLGSCLLPRSTLAGLLTRSTGFLSLVLGLGRADPFGDALLLTSAAIGLGLSGYTVEYSKRKYGRLDLVVLVDVFLISVALVFASSTLIELITFWLIAELLGFVLVAYDYVVAGDVLSISASIKYLAFSMIPTDLALFVLLALTGFEDAFEVHISNISPTLDNPVVLLMVLLGFFSKAAVFPLHFWLPDAHSVAPSPASAVLSGVMVKMGVYAIYMIVRFSIARELAFLVMLLSGFITAIYGGLQAILQVDIKRLLAYSTTSNTGLIVSLLAFYLMSGDRLFAEAAMLYSIAHAVYKATLFMDSGVIEVLAHTRELKRLGYISRLAPTETAAAALTILAALGLPPSVGFLAKLFTFASIAHHASESAVYVAGLLVATIKVAAFMVYNIVYLKAHLGGAAPRGGTSGKAGARGLQYSTLASSLLPYLLTPTLGLASLDEYVGLQLLEKLYPLIATSTLFVILLIPTLHKFLGWGDVGKSGSV